MLRSQWGWAGQRFEWMEGDPSPRGGNRLLLRPPRTLTLGPAGLGVLQGSPF